MLATLYSLVKTNMATTGQPSGQPMYLPPGTAPGMVAMQPNAAAPGAVMYYPQGSAGIPQGAVIMVRSCHAGSDTYCTIVFCSP